MATVDQAGGGALIALCIASAGTSQGSERSRHCLHDAVIVIACAKQRVNPITNCGSFSITQVCPIALILCIRNRIVFGCLEVFFGAVTSAYCVYYGEAVPVPCVSE